MRLGDVPTVSVTAGCFSVSAEKYQTLLPGCEALAVLIPVCIV